LSYISVIVVSHTNKGVEMDKVTKSEVKKSFKEVRELMRVIEGLLDTDDFTEEGTLGQTIMYLQAEISTVEAYRMYKQEATRPLYNFG